MKTPRLREAGTLREKVQCECCEAQAELFIVVDYDVNYNCSDEFAVCMTCAMLARRGEFEKFFELYGQMLMKRKGLVEPTWREKKDLRGDSLVS